MKKNKKNMKQSKNEITTYDEQDTLGMIDVTRPLHFEDLGLKLPAVPPTQVVSIRLPSALLNELKAMGSQQDIPYQALIKLLLSQSIDRLKRKVA